MRDTDAQVFDYPDVAHKKRFYETWNNCKREIKELQQTQLTENCTAYNFLTEDLAKLPTIEAKALKSSIKHFPEYRPLLQMQNGLLNNYQLVQGPRPVKATTEVRLPSISNHLLKDSASESKSETPIVLPTIETSEVNGQSQRFSPKKSYSRLNNSVFFGGSLQAKSESVSEKTSERNSRLNGSLFFAMAKAPSDLNVAKEKSIDRTIYIPDSVKLV